MSVGAGGGGQKTGTDLFLLTNNWLWQRMRRTRMIMKGGQMILTGTELFFLY